MEDIIFESNGKAGERFAIDTGQPQDVKKELADRVLNSATNINSAITKIAPLVKEKNGK